MKTNTIYIFIFSFILLVLAGASVWYVREQITYKINVVREYHSKQAQNKNFEGGTVLKKEIEILAQQEEIIKSTFLKDNSIVNFITQLESSGKNLELTVSINKVQYGASEVLEKKYTIKPVIFNVEAEGSFLQIKAYLASIATSENKLTLKEFKLYKNDTKERGAYTARIIIEGITLAYE